MNDGNVSPLTDSGGILQHGDIEVRWLLFSLFISGLVY